MEGGGGDGGDGVREASVDGAEASPAFRHVGPEDQAGVKKHGGDGDAEEFDNLFEKVLPRRRKRHPHAGPEGGARPA